MPERITVDSIRRSIFSPINNIHTGEYSDSSGIARSDAPRSLRMVRNEQILQQSVLANAKFLNKGPPMLPDNCSLRQFHEWQVNLKNFISKVPGYKDGILTDDPDFTNMMRDDKEFLVQIYSSIFSWLILSISLNSKCTNKTRNISVDPFPDIAGWWRNVGDVFALSTTEIEQRVENLNHFKQFPKETCKNYYSRFDDKAMELKQLGRNFDDIYLGEKCIRGMLPIYKVHAQQFLYSSGLKSTSSNVYELCKYLDEMHEEVGAKPEEIKALVVTATEPIRNSNISKYGPAENNNQRGNSLEYRSNNNNRRYSKDYGRNHEGRGR